MTTQSAVPGWYPDPSGAPRAGSDVPAQHRLSNKERAVRLDIAIAEEMGPGGRVESHTPDQAIIVYGGNDVLLHITIAVSPCSRAGFSCSRGSSGRTPAPGRRVALRVDPYGNVIKS